MAATNSIGTLSIVVTFTNGSAVIGGTNTLTAGQQVILSTTGSLPTNFSTLTEYYVSATGLSGTTLQLSATNGGTPIVAGSAGSGTQTLSRMYSTIGAWETAFAAGGWIGQCYNDSEFNESVTFSGNATSAVNFILLQPAPGQGFKDNASVQTNALAYNQANGVAWKFGVAYSSVVTISESFVTLQGLQIQQSLAAGNFAIGNGLTVSGCLVDSCILESLTTKTGAGVITTTVLTVINSLLVLRSAVNAPAVLGAYGNSVFANCTLVRPVDFTASNVGFKDVHGGRNFAITNCGVFGFSGGFSSTVLANTGSNNATDVASIPFGSSNLTSLTYTSVTSPFQNTLDATRDFRIKTGSPLIDAGATDTTDIPAAIDIVGTSRPQGTAWDIGCWELIVGSAVSLVGTATVRTFAKAQASLSTALLARASVQAKAKAATSFATSLTGKVTAQAKASGAYALATALTGRATVQASALMAGGARAFLVARASVQAKGRAAYSLATSLSGRSTVQAAGMLASGARAFLVARATVQAKGAAAYALATSLTARANVQVKARGALSAGLVAALTSLARVMAKGGAGPSYAAALLARATAQVKAALAQNAPLVPTQICTFPVNVPTTLLFNSTIPVTIVFSEKDCCCR